MQTANKQICVSYEQTKKIQAGLIQPWRLPELNKWNEWWVITDWSFFEELIIIFILINKFEKIKFEIVATKYQAIIY